MDNFVLELLVQSISDSEEFTSDSEPEDPNDTDIRRNVPQPIVKIKNYVELVVSAYSEITFKSHFRISRDIVHNLIEDFAHSKFSPMNEKGKSKVSNEKSVLVTIWYLSNTETFRQIADRFDISLSTAHAVLVRVLNFILNLCTKYIKWPTQVERRIVSADFENRNAIPNVVGAIDGCHIKIIRPREHDEVYVNRKGNHSLLLQGITTSKKIFTDIYCGEPGSLHDARVLRRSGIFTKAEDENCFGNSFLVGDSAYPSLSWLVPPFKDNGSLTERHKIFNYRHSSTRIVVEHTFGLLKGRFRRLQHLDNLDIKVSVKCIMASCILHNICMTNKDDTVIIMVDLTNNLISTRPPVDIYSSRQSRREEVFEDMFRY